MRETLLIFDLDGTILSMNSFPLWVRFMLRRSWRAWVILAQRKLLGHSHAETKERFQRLWVQLGAPEEFSLGLQAYVRPNLRGALAQSKDAILATSAAASYARGFGETLGFHHILATQTGEPENVGEAKHDRVLALIAAEGLGTRRQVFFTDHEEDSPLIRECELTLWFGDERGLALAQELAPAARIISCRELTNAQVMALLVD